MNNDQPGKKNKLERTIQLLKEQIKNLKDFLEDFKQSNPPESEKVKKPKD
ncbi:MAG: hypothetical protein ACM3S2_11275 [Ignavibacteriales bacterium]